MAVVMRAGLGVRLDDHRSGPKLLRADAREVDRRLAVHARGLRNVRVQLGRGNDAYAVMLPAVRVVVRMRAVIVRCRHLVTKSLNRALDRIHVPRAQLRNRERSSGARRYRQVLR